MNRLDYACLLTLLFTVLNGCGSSDSPVVGRAVFTVIWPPSRLIPAASNSIKVVIQRNSVAVETKVIPRPAGGGTASAEFQNLPLGQVIAIATAHPNADGTGVAQASGSVGFTVLAGQTTPFTLTMDSTIDRIEVNPPSVTLSPGQTQQLNVSARDSANQVVLISSGKLNWESLNTSAAAVSTSGLVTAQSLGTAQIRVMETESGKTATASVEVATQIQHIYVISHYTDDIKMYRYPDGQFERVLFGSNTGGLSRPNDFTFGADGNIYVASDTGSGVKRYNGVTGAFIDTFIPHGSGGLNNATAILFHNNGELLVGSAWTHEIKRYNGVTGAYLGNFASGNGLNVPVKIIYGPDGHLYVSSTGMHSGISTVKKYDGSSGAYLGDFVTADSGGLDLPYGLAFGPDGNFYVASHATHEIKRYNGTTGAFIDNFITAATGGLNLPEEIAFGPDGKFWVVSSGNDQIRRYNPTTGAFIDRIDPANAAGADFPAYLRFR